MSNEILIAECERKMKMRRRGFMILHQFVLNLDDDLVSREVYVDVIGIRAVSVDFDAEHDVTRIDSGGSLVYVEETPEEVFAEYDAVLEELDRKMKDEG